RSARPAQPSVAPFQRSYVARRSRPKGKRPSIRGAPKIQPARVSGSDLGRLDLQELAGTRDRDRPRLHGLRNLAHEVDMQEPVLQARSLDLDIIGQLEATL